MIKRQFETLKGTKQWGYIHVPADKTKKYPLVFFCHGSGEIGNSEAEAPRLLKDSPIGHLNNGWNPDFIVMAVQHHTFSFPVDRIMYLFANDPDIKSYWNGKAMITGLSAGGEKVIEFMRAYHNPDKFVYVPMSPSGNSGGLTATDYKVWGFVGDRDTRTPNARAALTDIYSRFGGRLTVSPEGHCCWGAKYDPNFKEDGKNIYEWWLSQIVVPPIDPPIDPPVPLPTTKKIAKMLITYVDGATEEVINSAK